MLSAISRTTSFCAGLRRSGDNNDNGRFRRTVKNQTQVGSQSRERLERSVRRLHGTVRFFVVRIRNVRHLLSFLGHNKSVQVKRIGLRLDVAVFHSIRVHNNSSAHHD